MTDQSDERKATPFRDYFILSEGVQLMFRNIMSPAELTLAASKIGLDVLAQQAETVNAATALARARVAIRVAAGSVVQKPADLIPMHDAVIEADPVAWEEEVREATADIASAPPPVGDATKH